MYSTQPLKQQAPISAINTSLVISTKIDIFEHYLRKYCMKRILKYIYFLPSPHLWFKYILEKYPQQKKCFFSFMVISPLAFGYIVIKRIYFFSIFL